MFCTSCGANNADGQKFCVGCGAPLGAGQPGVGQPGMIFSNNPNFVQPVSTKINFIALVGALMFIIGCFANYIKISIWGYTEGASIMSAGGASVFFGVFFILDAILIVVFAVLKKDLPISIIGFVALIWFIIMGIVLLHSEEMRFYSSMFTRGAGYWFLLLGCFVNIIAGVIRKVVPALQ